MCPGRVIGAHCSLLTAQWPGVATRENEAQVQGENGTIGHPSLDSLLVAHASEAKTRTGIDLTVRC